MRHTISAYQARSRFGEILDAVRYRKEPYVIERHGRPTAVIVDVEAYRVMEALLEDEQWIEAYSDQRVQEFLVADRLSPSDAARIKRVLKPT